MRKKKWIGLFGAVFLVVTLLLCAGCKDPAATAEKQRQDAEYNRLMEQSKKEIQQLQQQNKNAEDQAQAAKQAAAPTTKPVHNISLSAIDWKEDMVDYSADLQMVSDRNLQNTYVDGDGYVHAFIGANVIDNDNLIVFKEIFDIKNSRHMAEHSIKIKKSLKKVVEENGSDDEWTYLAPGQGIYDQMQYYAEHYNELPRE